MKLFKDGNCNLCELFPSARHKLIVVRIISQISLFIFHEDIQTFDHRRIPHQPQ